MLKLSFLICVKNRSVLHKNVNNCVGLAVFGHAKKYFILQENARAIRLIGSAALKPDSLTSIRCLSELINKVSKKNAISLVIIF